MLKEGQKMCPMHVTLKVGVNNRWKLGLAYFFSYVFLLIVLFKLITQAHMTKRVTISERVRGKKPQVTLDLMSNSPFFVEGSGKQCARSIMSFIRCHLGVFSMQPFKFLSGCHLMLNFVFVILLTEHLMASTVL